MLAYWLYLYSKVYHSLRTGTEGDPPGDTRPEQPWVFTQLRKGPVTSMAKAQQISASGSCQGGHLRHSLTEHRFQPTQIGWKLLTAEPPTGQWASSVVVTFYIGKQVAFTGLAQQQCFFGFSMAMSSRRSTPGLASPYFIGKSLLITVNGPWLP